MTGPESKPQGVEQGPPHTMGPWEFRSNDLGEEELVSVRSGYPIAHAAWTGGSGCELRIGKEADKHLIAAAPDLLSACETAMRQIRAAFSIIHPGDKALADGSVEQLRAAIARARGAQ